MSGRKEYELVVGDGCYQMGIDDFNEGKSLGECPFEDIGHDRNEWIKGWKDTRKAEKEEKIHSG